MALSVNINRAFVNSTQDQFDLPIEREVMFANKKGEYKKRIEKRQKKNLARVAPFIKNFLEPNEKLRLISTCCSPISFAEQLTTGLIVFVIKRALLVITDRRILHIPTTARYEYRESIAQIRFEDCTSLKVRGSTLETKYKNGKTERFYKVAEKSQMRKLFERPLEQRTPTQFQGRHHLCPRCGHAQIPDEYRCNKCHQEFLSKELARKYSLLYPGGGYFYTHHPFLGLGDALAETSIIMMILWAISKGNPSGLEAFLGFAILLVIEKAVSVYHSDLFVAEYIPVKKTRNPQSTENPL